jgi:hypothetical protein
LALAPCHEAHHPMAGSERPSKTEELRILLFIDRVWRKPLYDSLFLGSWLRGVGMALHVTVTVSVSPFSFLLLFCYNTPQRDAPKPMKGHSTCLDSRRSTLLPFCSCRHDTISSHSFSRSWCCAGSTSILSYPQSQSQRNFFFTSLLRCRLIALTSIVFFVCSIALPSFLDSTEQNRADQNESMGTG